MSDKARELAIKLQLLSQHSRVMHSEWVSEATSLIDAALKAARLEAIEAAKAYRELTICYRVGKRPSEKLFARLEKANTLLDALKEAKNAD